MPPQTYSDLEAEQIIRGSTTRSDIEWRTAICAASRSPELPGFKVGRKWRMIENDIHRAIELLRLEQQAVPEVLPTSMTRTSRRRLVLG